MAAAGKAKEKEPVDIVHQNAIHVETILKEQRTQKLYTEFSINPFKKREYNFLLISQPKQVKRNEMMLHETFQSDVSHRPYIVIYFPQCEAVLIQLLSRPSFSELVTNGSYWSTRAVLLHLINTPGTALVRKMALQGFFCKRNPC